MKIIFSPKGDLPPLELTKQGDTLTDGDGLTLDFGPLPNGATLPLCKTDADGNLETNEAGEAIRNIECWWIAGDVTRSDAGVLTVPVALPHGHNAPEETRFPVDIGSVPNGKVSLPPYNAPESEPEPEEEPA